MLEMHVIGCYGSRFGNHDLSTYLLRGENDVALDAGSICRLDDSAQANVRNVFVTHYHSDHWRDLKILAYNNIMPSQSDKYPQVKVVGTESTITKIIKDGFPGETWVPFQDIKIEDKAPIEFGSINPSEDFEIDQFLFKAYTVKHVDGSVAYLTTSNGCSILYTGDTGSLDERFWAQFRNIDGLRAVIIESSYPNSLTESNAKPFNHLSPELVLNQIEMLDRKDVAFYVVHFFPRYEAVLREEIGQLTRRGVNVSPLEQGKCYLFDEKITVIDSELSHF